MSKTPISDAARASGGWNKARDEAAAFDAGWMEKFLDAGTVPLCKGVLGAPVLADEMQKRGIKVREVQP